MGQDMIAAVWGKKGNYILSPPKQKVRLSSPVKLSHGPLAIKPGEFCLLCFYPFNGCSEPPAPSCHVLHTPCREQTPGGYKPRERVSPLWAKMRNLKHMVLLSLRICSFCLLSGAWKTAWSKTCQLKESLEMGVSGTGPPYRTPLEVQALEYLQEVVWTPAHPGSWVSKQCTWDSVRHISFTHLFFFQVSLFQQLHCYLVSKSYPTLCHPMDCSPPGSSVHVISQARILEWVAISFSRGSSPPRD